MEVACGPDSLLTAQMRDLAGYENSAQRFSIWNQFDLQTSAGLRSVIDAVDVHMPQMVWLAPECGPYSAMQNLNQKTEEQQQTLEEKRRLALKPGLSFCFCFAYPLDQCPFIEGLYLRLL